MTTVNTNIWETSAGHPLLWTATAALAFVAHLGLLHLGLTVYQAQLITRDDPKTETKIFATALQLAGAETPAPVNVEVETVAPTQAQKPVTSLQAAQPAQTTLSATVTSTPLAATPEALEPVTTPPSVETEVASVEQITSTEVQGVQPVVQPGVAPAAPKPLQSVTAEPADLVDTAETLEVATLDAQQLTGTELVPEPLQSVATSPLPELPTSLPPPPNSISEDTAGVAAANAPIQTTEQAQETYETVLNFLRSFDGGPCFAALPVLAEDGAFRFETFAQSNVDLNRFRQALEIETGTLPGTVMKPVSDAQCQALPFVTAAARYPEFQLYFDVAKRDIPSGETLSGKLGNTSGGFVSLLLIDDEGVVQDLGSFLKFRAGYAGFDIPMTLKGSPVETQQLLMALSTRARLKTLQSLSGEPAKDFFQRLAVEILLQGGGEDVALVAFSVR